MAQRLVASLVVAALALPSAVRANVNTTGTKDGIVCGLFSTASKNDVVTMLRAFSARFPAGSSDTCGAPALTCTRQACRNTSGLYFCNDNDTQADVPCTTVASWLGDITNGCCTTSVLESAGISGQQFSTAGWNVVVAYANCNHDADADRPSDFAMPGPNGACTNEGV